MQSDACSVDTLDVTTLRTSTINTTNSLKITSDVNEGWGHVVDLYAPNTSNGNTAILNFGKEDKYGCSAHIGFKYNETNKDKSSFIIGLHSQDNIIEVNKTTMTSKVDIDCPNIQCNTINGLPILKENNSPTKIPFIPVVQRDAVMEVGRIIDFHTHVVDGEMSGTDFDCRLWWNNNGNRKLHCTKTFTAPNVSSSFTVMHETGSDNHLNEDDLGKWCESDGTIYEMFKDNITYSDCICNIKLSNTLNKNVLGVLIKVDPPTFATHGDVLVKLDMSNNDTYEVGDILVCTENGYSKKADDNDIMFCLMHKIPTAKIISLDTPSGHAAVMM